MKTQNSEVSTEYEVSIEEGLEYNKTRGRKKKVFCILCPKCILRGRKAHLHKEHRKQTRRIAHHFLEYFSEAPHGATCTQVYAEKGRARDEIFV